MTTRGRVTVEDVLLFEAGQADERARLRPTVDRLALYAARYALGRRTYAVADVVETIIAHLDMLSGGTRDVLVGDIDRALSSADGAGMDIDRRQWERLRDRLETADAAGRRGEP